MQFTAPVCVSDYVHRVGRTARIGAKGSSVIFLLPSEAGFVKSLEAARIPLAEMTLGQVMVPILILYFCISVFRCFRSCCGLA